MNGEELWNIVISRILSTEKELQTKRGFWFRVISKGGKLYVDKAVQNSPSSKITKQRPISKKDFIFVFSYYERWVRGEAGIREEVAQKSQNTSYIFAIINHFLPS